MDLSSNGYQPDSDKGKICCESASDFRWAPISLFAGHSFRVGAASMVAAVGLDDSTIRA